MSDAEMNVNLPMSPHTPSPSPSSSSPPPSQLLSVTPEIFTRYPPKLVRRMQAETCYRCHHKGHWSWDCPLNSPNTKSLSPSTPNHDSISPINIWCRCGHGFCQVKTACSTRNCGRMYYACPIKRGKKCKEFIKWCEAENIDENDLRPPPYKYPECQCGAGVCAKVKATESSGLVKYYFVCPVGEDHGSCGYRVWEDELLKNKSIVPIQQSRQRTLNDFWEDFQHDKTDNDMGKGSYLLVKHCKRMRIMDNSENPSSMVVSDLSKKEDAAPSEASSKGVGILKFEVADYLQDLEFVNSVSLEDIMEEPLLISHLSTPSRILRGHCSMGWLGRLLFFNPTQSLKLPPLQPFFCCIFPSFDPIVVPKQASIGDGPYVEHNQLAISNIIQHGQLSTGYHTEVSIDAVSPNKSQGSGRKPTSKAERQRQVVLFAQQQLLIDLETLNPNDHESMREAAEATFDLLDNLGVNYKQFSDHVLAYIDLASSMAEMDKSMENSLTLDEYNALFEEEKVRFVSIQDECFNTEALLEASNQHRQTLVEEVSHFGAMLHEKQTQLKSCEFENLQIETNLDNVKRSLMEAEATLKVIAKEAERAKQLNEEKQAKKMASKIVIEKAKLEFEN